MTLAEKYRGLGDRWRLCNHPEVVVEGYRPANNSVVEILRCVSCGQAGEANVEIPEGYRRCSICREVKPLDEFYRNAGRPKGRKYRCRWCFQLALNRGAEEARRVVAASKERKTS